VTVLVIMARLCHAQIRVNQGDLVMAEIKGSCRCGKVSYSTSAEPVFAGICHCKTCQKSTGTAYATVVAVPAPTLTVTGSTKQFDDVADSGKATHRSFCFECGSTVTQWADAMPGITMVAAGTIDDPESIKPTMQIFCDSAMPWATVADMQSFPKMPG
jgi:hypothetical protein